ncbi:hypothetical protein IKG33_00590 [Candidatus Saccharibacteria bacterium]|nr:hypothetical protein [Candidatus Saccharibacteria bacterium]
MEETNQNLGEKKTKKRVSKGGDWRGKKVLSILVFVVGLIVLVVGLVFLILKLNEGAGVEDGEYLVSAKEWVLDEGTNCIASGEEDTTNCIPSVYWKFTEIGKGTLTTNNHLNDYDFIWAIEDGKILIETDWLYTLNDEYEYELDQNNGVLTLTSGENSYRFVGEFESK